MDESKRQYIAGRNMARKEKDAYIMRVKVVYSGDFILRCKYAARQKDMGLQQFIGYAAHTYLEEHPELMEGYIPPEEK